jgi:hypothetical protein
MRKEGQSAKLGYTAEKTIFPVAVFDVAQCCGFSAQRPGRATGGMAWLFAAFTPMSQSPKLR